MSVILAVILLGVLCGFQTEAMTLPPTPVQKPCVENGKLYMPGESFKPSPCQWCSCGNDGRVMCAIQDCAMPPCFDAVRPADQCCPVCPNGSNCKAHDGTMIEAGKQVTLASGEICSCPSGGSHWGHWGGSEALCVIKDFIQP